MRTATVNIGSVRHTGLRADASYHLSEGQDARRAVERSPYPLTTVGEVTKEIFYGTRAKRVYVSKRENGIPFLSSSDIMSADLENIKLASRKYTPDIERMTLQEGWTLISRSGTVGNCAYSTGRHAQKLASEHVIRVAPGGHPNDILRGGMLYAYLASHYGHSLLTQGTFGAVIQHIEPSFIASLPIPVFPASFQEEVDTLVKTAASLRDQAAKDLEKAKQLIIDYCETPFISSNQKENIIQSSKILHTLHTRFDAPVYINDGVRWSSQQKRKTVNLGDCSIKMWYPGIFKRAYVEDGYPYIKGSELFLANPFRQCQHLSRTKTPKLDQLWLKPGQILISCAGACGLVKLITKEYEDKKAIGSPDIIRLTSNDSLFTKEYLFAYLQIPAVYDCMQSFKYGSVIERFDIANMETLPIVVPTETLSADTTRIVIKYAEATYQAFCAEERAIAMVEQEIERWQTKK